MALAIEPASRQSRQEGRAAELSGASARRRACRSPGVKNTDGKTMFFCWEQFFVPQSCCQRKNDGSASDINGFPVNN